jgi:Protein of unknown function (DUF1501)/TAT (twin-arginine translocation) pathway signal sequence
MNVSRRRFLQGTGALGAAALTTGIPFGAPLAYAGRAGKKSAVVVIYTHGGFNGIFSSADSFLNGSFGVTSSNIFDAGNGLMVDKAFADGLGAYAKTHMAAVGIRHGTSVHEESIAGFFEPPGGSAIIRLARAMGGDAAIKAASILNKPAGNHAAVGNVSLQQINDMGATIATLQGGAAAEPARNLANRAAIGAELMSKERAARNPASLRSDAEGRQALIRTLSVPGPNFDFSAIPAAYKLNGTGISANNGNKMNAPMAAAELMVRAGVNVVTVTTGLLWDLHFSEASTNDRRQMITDVVPGVQTFINRMMADPATAAEYDVTVVLAGDFGRVGPQHDHASAVSAIMIGPGIKVGTSGRMSAQVGLPVGTPSWGGMWSMLCGLTAAPSNPFGPIPDMHKALLL